ncbi:UNVERIFIED_CONTAM: hypothetical protein ABIC26_002967 [Paenibacillus sp. PvR008]
MDDVFFMFKASLIGVTVMPLLVLLVIVNLIPSSIQLIGDPYQPMSNFNLNIIFFWVLGLAFVPTAYLAVRACNPFSGSDSPSLGRNQ